MSWYTGIYEIILFIDAVTDTHGLPVATGQENIKVMFFRLSKSQEILLNQLREILDFCQSQGNLSKVPVSVIDNNRSYYDHAINLVFKRSLIKGQDLW